MRHYIRDAVVRLFLPLRSKCLTVRDEMCTKFRENYDEGQGDAETSTWMVPVEESFMALELGLGKIFIDGDRWNALIAIC